jgi:hypothetical protein
VVGHPGQLVERAQPAGQIAFALGASDDLLDEAGVLEAPGDVIGDEQDDRVGRDGSTAGGRPAR